MVCFKVLVDCKVVFILIFILFVMMLLLVYCLMLFVVNLIMSVLFVFKMLLMLDNSKSFLLRSFVMMVVVWLVFIFNKCFCGFELMELMIGKMFCVNIFFKNVDLVVVGIFIVLYFFVRGLYIIIFLFNSDNFIGVIFVVSVVV